MGTGDSIGVLPGGVLPTKNCAQVSQILADFGELEKESEIDFDRFKQLVVPTSAAASQTVATLRTSSGSRRANADDAQLTVCPQRPSTLACVHARSLEPIARGRARQPVPTVALCSAKAKAILA